MTTETRMKQRHGYHRPPFHDCQQEKKKNIFRDLQVFSRHFLLRRPTRLLLVYHILLILVVNIIIFSSLTSVIYCQPTPLSSAYNEGVAKGSVQNDTNSNQSHLRSNYHKHRVASRMQSISTRTICEGDQLYLSCEPSLRILISQAWFGIMGASRTRLAWGLKPLSCQSVMSRESSLLTDQSDFSEQSSSDSKCPVIEVTSLIAKHCHGMRTCQVNADNGLLKGITSDKSMDNQIKSETQSCPEEDPIDSLPDHLHKTKNKFKQLKLRYTCVTKKTFDFYEEERSKKSGDESVYTVDPGDDLEVSPFPHDHQQEMVHALLTGSINSVRLFPRPRDEELFPTTLQPPYTGPSITTTTQSTSSQATSVISAPSVNGPFEDETPRDTTAPTLELEDPVDRPVLCNPFSRDCRGKTSSTTTTSRTPRTTDSNCTGKDESKSYSTGFFGDWIAVYAFLHSESLLASSICSSFPVMSCHRLCLFLLL